MIKDRIKARYNALLADIGQEKPFYIFMLLCMIVPATFVIITHTHTLPYAEGWYTYYAKCINEGLLPYRDFEYLYPPLYIYAVALITRVFGYDLIILRRFGILFFSLISLGVYLAVCEIVGKKRSWIAMVASVTAVFFLQSEIVQTFYDYVRIMDMLAAFSLLFLIKCIKGTLNGSPRRRDLVLLGTVSALFCFTKQNIGLIFFVYALVLLLYANLWCRRERKAMLRDYAHILAPVGAVAALVFGFLLITGSLSGFLSMTGLNAASAKGGLSAILFGWVINNMLAFKSVLSYSLVLLILLVGLFFLNRFAKAEKEGDAPFYKSLGFWSGVAFAVLMMTGLITFMLSKDFALAVNARSHWSPYSIFLIVFPIFVACGMWGIVDMVRGTDTMRDVFLLFALSGAYFAISFGCGNSGGLAEGQATFGVAFIVTAFLLLLDRKELRPIQIGVLTVCLFLSLHCAEKKMVATYNWWGLSEPDYWACTETTDLPHLRGLKLSPQTKAVYESIYHAVKEGTSPEDSMIAFPHIPIFYNLCDRNDPGLFAKVQWFDVATDGSVLADLEHMKQNPPKAILIYNSSDFAYNSHEYAFRGGNVSGTRLMRAWLWEYAFTNGYRYEGTFIANSNTLSLWIYDPNGAENGIWFAGGDGSADNPYLVSTPEHLQLLARLVGAGNSFENMHVRQTCNIDLEGIDIPAIIGTVGDHTFKGSYDKNGFTINRPAVQP